jgi:hypothetical protein
LTWVTSGVCAIEKSITCVRLTDHTTTSTSPSARHAPRRHEAPTAIRSGSSSADDTD